MGEGILEGVVQCGRQLIAEELEDILTTVGMFPRLSRRELAQTLCEHLEWVSATGSYKTDACIKLLEKLEAAGWIELPRKREVRASAGKAQCWTYRTDPGSDICGRLGELEPVWLDVILEREGTELWNEYVGRYHYLGYKKPFGCFLRYFIVSGRGVVGCVLFAGAAKSIGARDRWIGWSEGQRLKNLPWVVNNTRFLIFPWVRVMHLASHVLGQVAKRLREDWDERWGYRPVLMESFVDPALFAGTCYRAAGWISLGKTTGEGLRRPGRQYKTTPKMIYVRPLVEDFRRAFCSDGLVGRAQR